ncbi:MAG: pyridoxal phosphate-dependent aminotransferase [Leptospiraceae bacterium]|nr:pyridoxal phosphate-dependent aminotransferase [Leptospiraceae bacterium]
MSTNYLASAMSRIDSSEIRRVFALAASLKNPINLSIGQPHFATPPNIIAAMDKAARDGHTSYTQTNGIQPLREAMAARYHQTNGFDSDPGQILISSGVAALIHLFMLAAINPGDRILITDPCFLIYRSMLNFAGAVVEVIPENFDRDTVAAMQDQKYKFIIYCSPSNPSGYVMRREQIEWLGQLADACGAILVADEIYELFDYENRFVSAGSVYPRSLVFSGFSKSWNMTGLRLAAVATPRGSGDTWQIIQAMTTLQQYTFVCAPAPVQWAGIEALRTDISDYVNQYRRNRDRCVHMLRGSYTIDLEPGGAFYLFPRLPAGRTDREFVEAAIQQKELLVVPGRIFTSQNDRIRISYAAEEDILERGLQALVELAA